MAQEKQTPMQLLQKFMAENNYPIDSKLLSYILVLDMYFAKQVKNAYSAGFNSQDKADDADKYYFMKFIDND
jgi:hypothetical protein